MLFRKLLFVLFFLAGCGWTPVYYSKSENAGLETEKIDVLPIPEETGRFLRTKLENLLNPSKTDFAKEYTLQVILNEHIDSDQGILGDNTATRATMQINAHILLKQKENVLLETDTFAISSYNILMLPYPSVTAEEATRRRLLDALASQIATRVTVYFKKHQDNQ